MFGIADLVAGKATKSGEVRLRGHPGACSVGWMSISTDFISAGEVKSAFGDILIGPEVGWMTVTADLVSSEGVKSAFWDIQ